MRTHAPITSQWPAIHFHVVADGTDLPYVSMSSLMAQTCHTSLFHYWYSLRILKSTHFTLGLFVFEYKLHIPTNFFAPPPPPHGSTTTYHNFSELWHSCWCQGRSYVHISHWDNSRWLHAENIEIRCWPPVSIFYRRKLILCPITVSDIRHFELCYWLGVESQYRTAPISFSPKYRSNMLCYVCCVRRWRSLGLLALRRVCTCMYVPAGMYRCICTGAYVPARMYRCVCTGAYIPVRMYRCTVL